MQPIEIKNLHINIIAELQKEFGKDIKITTLNLPNEPATMAMDSALYDVAITFAGGVSVQAFCYGIKKLFEKYGINKTVVNNREVVINNITVNQFVSIIEKEQSIGDSEKNSQ